MSKKLFFLISFILLLGLTNGTAQAELRASLEEAAGSSARSIDLTAEGTADWAYWWFDSVAKANQKAGATDIGELTLIGNVGVGNDWKTHFDVVFTDGQDPVSGSVGDVGNRVWIQNAPPAVDEGYELVVTAGFVNRTLKLYIQNKWAYAKIVATLGDESVETIVDSGDSGQIDYVYTLEFSHPLAHELHVRYFCAPDAPYYDSVRMGAATLSGPLVQLQTKATEPSPGDGQEDVSQDVVLSWRAGVYVPAINGHKVYFSENFNDVNDGIGGITQSASRYAPGRLDLCTTYYWRVDEVNAPSDSTVHQGNVWSFTTELLAYPIDGNNITATASSTGKESMGTENTINSSGLDANDLHSTQETAMWLSNDELNGAWIEYELDKTHKLHEMWVWNSNGVIEPVLGFGLKDVTIEYSTNGTDYTILGTTHEFVRAPGAVDYAHNTTVDFGGTAAKYVRLTAHSNWGGVLEKYGLSEVDFFHIPVHATEPSPDSGATDVAIDVTLSWRAGREAAKHDVYLSTDEQAVIDGTASVNTVTENSYSPSPLDVATTYYWRVDEVNDAETPTTWQGDIWNFTTQEYLVVDDFELYNDLDPGDLESKRIFNTWIDGYGTTTNGSIVGYDVAPFAEQDIVHGGNKSMPFFYDNSTAGYSEATANATDLQIGRDWSKGSPQALVLWIYGDPGNAATDQLYMEIDSSKVIYDGDIAIAQWSPWAIDLASLGVNLNNVSTVTIGLERTGGSGGSGVIFVDDIRLYGTAPAVSLPPDPSVSLTVNPSFESPDLGPGGTGQWTDYVDNWIIDNTQASCYLEDGSWQVVAPDGAATLKMWSGAAIWQQIGNVSPNTDYEISMFIGKGYDDTCAVQVELWAGGNPSLLPTEYYGQIEDTVGATLIGGAPLVPTAAVGENEWMSLILNTGAGFNTDDALWLRIESTGYAAWVDYVMVTKQ